MVNVFAVLPSVGDLIPIHWNASHYKVTWIPVQNATSYTLYYCKKTAGMLCKVQSLSLVYDIMHSKVYFLWHMERYEFDRHC